MNIFLPDCNTASRPYAAWAGATALTLGALFGASNSYAAAPPANTLIGNQAVAAYVDSTGVGQTSTSNLVQTSVQQVGSFLLDSNSLVTANLQNTKTGAGGNTVYAPHVLTNTGNGTDTFAVVITAGPNGLAAFSNVEVFADANNDGLPDSTTALCSAPGLGTCTVPAQTVAGNGGTFPFVVAYTIPAGSTTPTTPYGSGTVTATPGRPLLYAGGPNDPTPLNLLDVQTYSAADVDNVNLTTVAAFSATKSLTLPAVAPTAAQVSWPAALTSGQRSSGAACATTSPVTNSATCQYTVYTLNYKNTGGAAGAFYIQDTLPAGFTYVTGSAVWSSAGGQALTEAAGTETVAGIDFAQSGQSLAARIASVGVNVSGTISFIVRVDSDATVGTGNTTNIATYDPLTTANGTAVPGTAGTATTNPSAFTVTATASVVTGSATGTAVGSLDGTPGTPNGTAFDLNTVATIISGGSAKFTQTLFNTGNDADTFNLTTTGSTFPSGSVFTFFAADGVTPLLDTNGDGTVDSGSVAAGGSTTIVMQVTIPAATPAAAGVNYTVVVRGTSVADATKFDAARNTVTSVVGALVDLTNTAAGTGVGTVGNGDLGAGPSPLPTTVNSTPAGTVTSFPLYVKNNESLLPAKPDLIFNLAASQSTSFPGSLPAGWTVTFNNAATCLPAGAITTTTVASGAQSAIFACVTPPVSQAAGTTNIYFKVTSTGNASTGVIVSDTKTDAVTVTAAATFGATLTPNNNGQVAPGGTVVYAHTLNATGAQSCGNYTLTATQSQAGSGWTYALFIDVNGNGQIDAGDAPVTSTTINAALRVGAPQKILVRVFAPGGAVPGIQDSVVVTATFTAESLADIKADGVALGYNAGTTPTLAAYEAAQQAKQVASPNGGVCGPVSATDISTVVTGQIRVIKTQALDALCYGTADTAFSAALIANAKPGQCVIYKVIATNEGTAAITNLTINDAVPNYTSLTGAVQPASPTGCVKSAAVIGAPAFASTTSTVSCGTATTVPPSGTLELNFAVKINS